MLDYDHSTCMHYDHNACIMSHSEAPRESRGGWGAAGPPTPFRVLKKTKQMGQAKLEVEKKNNRKSSLGGRCSWGSLFLVHTGCT